MLVEALKLVGIWFVVQVASHCVKFFLRPAVNLKAEYGDWAVVTGATDGIGMAYTKALAKQGLNIVLISRTKSKLDTCAGDLESKFGVSTKVIAIDYQNDSEDDIKSKLKNGLLSVSVGVLINNVGQSYDYPEYYLDIPETKVTNLIRMNIDSVLLTTDAILPGMVERRKGAIVNVSSFSSLFAMPLLAVYGASKGFVNSFSHSLNMEYASKGIFVQCVTPLYITTKLSKIRKPNLLTPTPDNYVRSALSTIGYDSTTCGYLMHDIVYTAAKLMNPLYSIGNVAFSNHVAIRKKALKKLASKKTN